MLANLDDITDFSLAKLLCLLNDRFLAKVTLSTRKVKTSEQQSRATSGFRKVNENG